ncbi:hypothetical protein An01g03990 [Aspergillus niger]|uniref:Uncharacterized protein n=2 Tax=Aspergillus niger TaxID=5061 RepID=A2Q8D8_ASPNC|nr:hypothetical protein An01g03990 [Aspergillus niger]CAK36935.1 hypothetical protein An01g03990 [Aspergillus niger]
MPSTIPNTWANDCDCGIEDGGGISKVETGRSEKEYPPGRGKERATRLRCSLNRLDDVHRRDDTKSEATPASKEHLAIPSEPAIDRSFLRRTPEGASPDGGVAVSANNNPAIKVRSRQHRAFAARLLYAVREGSQSPLAIDLVIGQGGGETKDRKEETAAADDYLLTSLRIRSLIQNSI